MRLPRELDLGAPGPCAGCAHAPACATGLACGAFALFVDLAGERRWLAAPREPTREIYLQTFGVHGLTRLRRRARGLEAAAASSDARI